DARAVGLVILGLGFEPFHHGRGVTVRSLQGYSFREIIDIIWVMESDSVLISLFGDLGLL
ncbi:MAG: hypothetical protein WCE96_07595, partial [Nitrososphaeraceae archaeon]